MSRLTRKLKKEIRLSTLFTYIDPGAHLMGMIEENKIKNRNT